MTNRTHEDETAEPVSPAQRAAYEETVAARVAAVRGAALVVDSIAVTTHFYLREPVELPPEYGETDRHELYMVKVSSERGVRDHPHEPPILTAQGWVKKLRADGTPSTKEPTWMHLPEEVVTPLLGSALGTVLTS